MFLHMVEPALADQQRLILAHKRCHLEDQLWVMDNKNRCVCVCVCVWDRQRERERERERETHCALCYQHDLVIYIYIYIYIYMYYCSYIYIYIYIYYYRLTLLVWNVNKIGDIDPIPKVILIFTIFTMSIILFIFAIHIYQPLRSGNIWHKVNF